MIFVANQPVSWSSSSPHQEQQQDRPEEAEEDQVIKDTHPLPKSQILAIVDKLLEHPDLLSSTANFKQRPVLQIKTNPDVCTHDGAPLVHGDFSFQKVVYVFQREYACASPIVELIGTDEATTCVGVALHNPDSGLISVGHLDFERYVAQGVSQMVTSVHAHADTLLQVHLVGGYDDSSGRGSIEPVQDEGYSKPLVLKLVEVLHYSLYKFHVQTMCVLQHNTGTGASGHCFPLTRGFVVQTRTGQITPAIFDADARCPDGIVRRICLSAESLIRKDELRAPYDTFLDRFVIAPSKWNRNIKIYALNILRMSDEEVLINCSTSPYAESPDFVKEVRRIYAYLYQHPDWKYTFPNGEPRVHARSTTGGWIYKSPVNIAGMQREGLG